ncbi:MAG: glycogen synthase GlgA [Caulobacteraceae bacterium]|nr:glycogen synthase GlgA [Caulobacteraceae bacterium]
MRVLFVASEAYPLAKTGGLGDVCRALPNALMEKGVDVRLLLPAYPSALETLVGGRVEASLDGVLGVPDGRLISGRLPNSHLPTWLVDAPSLYRRPGGPYTDEAGADWADNALRFAYLSQVGALIGLGLAAYWKADVVHANDWQTGLLPMMLRADGRRRPRTVFTIHNLAFQGLFPLETARGLGVRDEDLTSDGCEFYGQASFLKAGVRFADRVTTVSPTYAREILTPDFGVGFDGLLRERGADFRGILNGVEEALWNPATDPRLPALFSARDMSGKPACKAALQRELGLPVAPDVPLVGFASRLTQQKMADVLVEALPWFAKVGAQLAIVAQGDPAIAAALAEVGRLYPDNLAVHIGYEEPLAHRLYAGADMMLAPARFEPCGLTQLYAMRYGALPIVRRTGGLADTVIDADAETLAARTATGFIFDEVTAGGMIGAAERAFALHRQPLAWRRLQLQAMGRDFGWDASATEYLRLYRDLLDLTEPRPRPAEPVDVAEEPPTIAL